MQKRIIVSILLSIFVILAGLGLISHLRVRDSIRRSAEDRLALANIIGTFVDHIIEENLTRLYDISLSDKIDFSDGDWGPERAVLRAAYEYSIFTDGVFLLGKNGTMALTYPDREGTRVNLRHIPAVGRVLSEMKPVVSGVHTMEPTKKKSFSSSCRSRTATARSRVLPGGDRPDDLCVHADHQVHPRGPRDRYRACGQPRHSHRIEQSPKHSDPRGPQ